MSLWIALSITTWSLFIRTRSGIPGRVASLKDAKSRSPKRIDASYCWSAWKRDRKSSYSSIFSQKIWSLSQISTFLSAGVEQIVRTIPKYRCSPKSTMFSSVGCLIVILSLIWYPSPRNNFSWSIKQISPPIHLVSDIRNLPPGISFVELNLCRRT